MSKNNSVFQVLVTKGNSSVLAKEKAIKDLVPGQIGIFDAKTQLAVDGTKPVKEFFIGVGVDRTGDGTMDSVNVSAGSVGGAIQTRLISNYTFRPHTAPKPQVVEIKDIKADCETEYILKIEFFNQRKYRLQGYMPYTKSFSVTTGCCTKCEEKCDNYDSNELVKLLVNSINSDTDGVVKAEAVQANGTVIADLDAFIATNKAVNTDDNKGNDVKANIRLTTVPVALGNVYGINLKYYSARATTMNVTFIEGFDCSSTIKVTQDAVSEEGHGYDVMQREYKAGGWNGRPGPYRTSAINGIATDGFEFFADANTKYDLISLDYDNEAEGGWITYTNDLRTEIAIPEADTTTRNSFIGVLDKVVAAVGFDALADDAAAANTNSNITEKTTAEINNPDLDGIG